MPPKADESSTKALEKKLEDVQVHDNRVNKELQYFDRLAEQWKGYAKEVKGTITSEERNLLKEEWRLIRDNRKGILDEVKQNK